MEKEIVNIAEASVAQALAADYFCIYYVNVDDDRFIEYSASPEYRKLGLPKSGDDLIGFARTRFDEIVFPEDRKRFLETFTKENIIRALDAHGNFTMSFRIVFDGKPTHVHLKATRMADEAGKHVVIGISNIEAQMRQQAAYRQAAEDRITFSRVAQALAADFFSIYVVDPDTDHFLEYSATEQYDELGLEKEGEDFFRLSRRNMDRIIFPGDRDRFMQIFTKDKILAITERDGHFTTKYRLMFGDTPVWVSMKATLLKDRDGRRLIIGTNNIDAQMKREEEYRAHLAEARTTARNDFLANMSHDIRTPMNAIVGYTNIASSSRGNAEAVHDALDKIGSASHFLLSLINDILDISKIESGQMHLNPAPCDLNALLRRIEDITQLQAKDKDLKISYDHSGIVHYRVTADELRIEQVLINIISNAIKYTPEGKSVDLTAGELGEGPDGKRRYRFVVRDTGIGISEEYLPHLFESFTREERTTVNRVQGTGLGLAITARVVELMGGRISVESKVGEGSVFTVELDLEPAGEQTEAQNRENSEFAALRGRRVLLVEDNAVNAEIAAMILEQYGLETDRAENGQLGVERVRNAAPGTYDAVLMDIQMPVMDGYEATRAIRALESPEARSLPIIAMSANAYDEDVRSCLEAGMNAHIAKPFQPEALMTLLLRHIWEKEK